MKSKVAGTQAGTQPRGLCPLVRRRGAGGGLSLGPSGSGCRGPGAGGLPALHSSWPRLDGPQPDCRGRRGVCSVRTPSLSAVLGSLLDSSFVFFFLKKKQIGFHGLGLWVLLCRQGEGRPDGARCGAREASPWRKAHCVGVGLGGRGPGTASLFLFIQREQTAPSAGCGKGGGSTGTLGSTQVCALPSPSGSNALLSGHAYLEVPPKLLELGRGVGEEA